MNQVKIRKELPKFLTSNICGQGSRCLFMFHFFTIDLEVSMLYSDWYTGNLMII